MMGFQVIVLWSDVLIWLLVAAGVGVGYLIAHSPPLLSAWRRVGANRMGVASAMILVMFVIVGLLDSLHFREQLDGQRGEKTVYSVEVLSVLDVLVTPLRTRHEKTYSAPMATRLYAMESVDVPGKGSVREFPRLKYGGAHLGDGEEAAPDDIFSMFNDADAKFGTIRDENGKEVRYNNYSDYYNSNSPEEKKKLGDLSAQNNKLIKDIENAKTKEEKNKLNQELTKVNQQMYDIVYGKMTYAELGTGMSLAYSAISYKDGVLVVDKKKMDQAVGTSNLSIGTTGLGLLDLQMALGNKAAIESGNNAKNDVIPKSDSYNEYAVKDSEIPNKIVSDVNKNSSNFNKLPNLEKAQIDSKKITNYALDPNHPVGGNKAKVFESSLGYNQSNSDSLIAQIKQQLPNSEAVLGVKNEYGQRFTVDMQIKGPNGNTATVRTGWIFDIGSDTPRLTTLFVK